MKKLLILLLIAAVASCKVGENYQGTTVNVPEAYRATAESQIPDAFLVKTDTLEADSLIQTDWFSLFQDQVLDTLISQSLKNNQDLLIAWENILQAQSALLIQKTERLPEFGYQAGVSRGNFQNLLLPQAQTTLFGAGFVNWEIDFWGKFKRLNEAAKANLIASEAGYRATELSLRATVASLYFQLLEYHTRLQISEQTVALRDSMLSIIDLRFEKGIVPEIDVNQAQIQLAIAEAQIPVWQRLLIQTENQISVLTGRNPQGITTGLALHDQDTSIQIPEGLPLSLLTRRPDVVQAEQELVAQNERVGVAQANQLPSISLSALLGIAGPSIDQLGTNGAAWNVGGSLLGPIFFFKRFKRLTEIEKSRRAQAQLNYEKTVLQALQEVEDVLVAIRTLKTELIARNNHVQAALNAQRLSQERYNQGVTSYLEYLESQRQAFDAQLNYAGTKQQLLSSYAQLYKALGGGWDNN